MFGATLRVRKELMVWDGRFEFVETRAVEALERVEAVLCKDKENDGKLAVFVALDGSRELTVRGLADLRAEIADWGELAGMFLGVCDSDGAVVFLRLDSDFM